MSTETEEQGTVRYIRCQSCGSPNPATASNCARCGKPLQAASEPLPVRPTAPPGTVSPALVKCPKCGKSFPAGSKFCGYCGTGLPAAPAAAPSPAAPSPAAQAGAIREAPVPKPVARPPAPPPPAPPRVPLKVTTPAARPAAAPPPPPPRSAPPAAIPPAPAKAAPPAPPPAPAKGPTPPAPAPRMPVAAPPTASLDGTVVFTGFHTPKIEASVIEKKPDGSAGKSQRITKQTVIGRSECDLNYAEDVLLSPRHATLAAREGKLFLRDLDSQNGTFVRQRQDSELLPGDIFLIGGELFRFTTQVLEEPEPAPQGTLVWSGPQRTQRGPVSAKLEHIKVTGEVVAEFRLEKPETTLGRTTGDLVFGDDRFMSGTHARIVAQPGRFILQDLRSRNGVYRRIRTEVELLDGDEFFLGEHIFRVEVKTVE